MSPFRQTTRLAGLAAAGLLTVGLPAGRAPAQPPPPPGGPLHGPEAATAAEPGTRGPGRRGRGPATRGTRPIDRWLQAMEARHPGEVQRLRALRQDDPEAFRREMWQHLEEARARFGGPPPHAGPPGGGPPPAAGTPPGDGASAGAMAAEVKPLLRQLWSLARSYRAAPDEEARAALRGQMLAPMGQLVDIRESERARRLARMEQEVGRLRQELETRRRDRAAFVAARVEELLKALGPASPAADPL